MQIDEVSVRSQCTILTLSGDLDAFDVPALRLKLVDLLAARPNALICDLAGVGTVTPAAAAAFAVAAHPSTGWPACPVLLCGARPEVAAVLRRHGTGPAAMCDTRDDAILRAATFLPVVRLPLLPVAGHAARPGPRVPVEVWSRSGLVGVTEHAGLGDRMLRIHPTLRPPSLRLEGELDRTNTPALAAALGRMVASGRDVRLDLSRLHAIDLDGLRLLARVAGALPADCSLILDPISRRLRALLRLSGWDLTPRMRLHAGPG